MIPQNARKNQHTSRNCGPFPKELETTLDDVHDFAQRELAKHPFLVEYSRESFVILVPTAKVHKLKDVDYVECRELVDEDTFKDIQTHSVQSHSSIRLIFTEKAIVVSPATDKVRYIISRTL